MTEIALDEPSNLDLQAVLDIRYHLEQLHHVLMPKLWAVLGLQCNIERTVAICAAYKAPELAQHSQFAKSMPGDVICPHLVARKILRTSKEGTTDSELPTVQ